MDGDTTHRSADRHRPAGEVPRAPSPGCMGALPAGPGGGDRRDVRRRRIARRRNPDERRRVLLRRGTPHGPHRPLRRAHRMALPQAAEQHRAHSLRLLGGDDVADPGAGAGPVRRDADDGLRHHVRARNRDRAGVLVSHLLRVAAALLRRAADGAAPLRVRAGNGPLPVSAREHRHRPSLPAPVAHRVLPPASGRCAAVRVRHPADARRRRDPVLAHLPRRPLSGMVERRLGAPCAAAGAARRRMRGHLRDVELRLFGTPTPPAAQMLPFLRRYPQVYDSERSTTDPGACC